MTGTKRERAIRAGYDACGGRWMPSNAVIVFAEAFHAVMSKPEPVDGGNIAGGTVTGVETEMAEAELCERGFGLGEWEVWAIDGDGAIVTATFAGAGAESRAEEYAVAKYGGFERRAPDRQQPERYRRTVVRLVKGSVEVGAMTDERFVCLDGTPAGMTPQAATDDAVEAMAYCVSCADEGDGE